MENRLLLASIAVLLLLLLPLSLVWGRKSAHHIYDRQQISAFASVIAHSDDIIYITDTNGIVLFVNESFIRTTGYTAEEIIGRSTRTMKSGVHPREFYQHLWQTISAGNSFEGMFENRKKDGTTFYENKKISPVCNAQGKIIYYVSVGTNLEKKYRAYEHEMEISSQLAASMSHHFKNLLNGITGYTQLAITNFQDLDGKKATQYLQKVVDVSAKIETLLVKIEQVRHIGIQDMPLVDPITLVSDVVVRMRSNKPEKVTLLYDSALPQEAEIRCNAELMQSAISELLTNAFDEIAGDGTVTICLSLRSLHSDLCISCHQPIYGEFVQISVGDSGNGIDEDILGNVFDPFFSTKESSKLVAQTPGLGLTIVRGVVHMHHGHMLFRCSTEGGLVVDLLLPVAKST